MYQVTLPARHFSAHGMESEAKRFRAMAWTSVTVDLDSLIMVDPHDSSA